MEKEEGANGTEEESTQKIEYKSNWVKNSIIFRLVKSDRGHIGIE